MLLNAFFCVSAVSRRKSSSFNIFSTSVIAFIKCRNRHHMKNNMRYKGSIIKASIIMFLKSKVKKFLAMVLCLGEPLGRFLWCCCHFWSSFCCCIFILLLFFIFRFSSFTFSSRRHPSPFRGQSPDFYTHFILSAQPIAEWLATLSFSTIPLIFLPRTLRS